MKMRVVLMVLALLFLGMGCEKTVIYEQPDSTFTNDLLHGNISGKVLQSGSEARVFVHQEVPIDSTQIQPESGIFRINDLSVGNYDVFVRAENYRTYQRRNVMIDGGATAYLGEIDLSTVPDLVASHYPEDKDEVVYSNRYSRLTISFTFTQPMDRESVEEAFSTDPPSEGRFYWGLYSSQPSDIYYNSRNGAYAGFREGATISTYSKITAFSFAMAQKDSYTDTTYTVRLSTAAEDTAGNSLRFPLEFTFSTVQSSTTLNTIETTPVHGDIDVTPLLSQGIRLTFPRRMDHTSTEAAVSLSPSQSHQYIWPESNQLAIYTGGTLMADTLYEVTIDSTAKDLDGTSLGAPFSFSFETAPVQLTSTQPQNGELYVNPSTEITMRFNTYMVKSSVQDAFSIEPAVSGDIRWGTSHSNDDKTALTFHPSGTLQSNTKYTVTIDTAAVDLFGTAIPEVTEFSFITRPE